MRHLWLFCLCVPLYAQSVDLSGLGTGTKSLEGQWKFHAGDNPRWADPDFDDSKWGTVKVPEGIAQQGYPGFSGYGWYRLELRFDGVHAPDLDLKKGGISGVAEFYANGVSIGRYGSFPPHPRIYFVHPAVFHLSPSLWSPNGHLLLAVRIWADPRFTGLWQAGLAYSPPSIGSPALVRTQIEAQQYQDLLDRSLDPIIICIELALTFYLLTLCFSGNRRPEYFWFALQFAGDLAQGILRWIGAHSEILTAPQIAYSAWLLISPLQISFVYGCWSLYSVGVPRVLQGVLAALTLSEIWNIAAVESGHASTLNSVNPFIHPESWLLLIVACTISAFLLARLRYGSSATRWLAFSVLANTLILIARNVLVIFPFWRRFTNQGYLNSLGDLSYLFIILALGYLIMRRFGRAQAEQERLHSEMQAAQEIQSLLLPSRAPVVPGFDIDIAYLPSQEVGGDFFQIAASPDGSLLVAIGDVSGKGLRAALTVSLIVGLWKEITATILMPAEILTRLNAQLIGTLQEGFVTCLCARLENDGRLIIANAGHLAPYRNVGELAIVSELPLGITPETNYAGTQHFLTPEDTLSLVSDGVVEARDKQRAMFGFDRLQQALAEGLSADALARHAQRFGQEDDITVVSITRQPVRVHVA